MATLHPKHRPSLEAIAYQGRSLLFNDLSVAFENLREVGKYDALSVNRVAFEKIVFKHTGLRVEILVNQDDFEPYNMQSFPPILDVNSPLLAYARATGLGDLLPLAVDKHKHVLAFSKDLRGSIDRAHGRVSGVFSKIVSRIFIGKGMLTDVTFTPDECAAVFLHELGHIFSFFDTLGQMATTNMVMSSAVQQLSGMTDETQRIKLVVETTKALNIHVDNVDALAKTNNSDVFSAVILKAALGEPLKSTHGSETYDLRSAEFLADQFATRHGGGRFLVSATDKMSRMFDYSYRRNTVSHFAVEAFKVGAWMVASFHLPIITASAMVLYLATNPMETVSSDDPGERMARIKRDLVQAVKNPKLPREARAQLVQDIDVIDAIREDIKDRRSVLSLLWVALNPRHRHQYSQMRIQQELEGLVNNDLFTHAAKLQTAL